MAKYSIVVAGLDRENLERVAIHLDELSSALLALDRRLIDRIGGALAKFAAPSKVLRALPYDSPAKPIEGTFAAIEAEQFSRLLREAPETKEAFAAIPEIAEAFAEWVEAVNQVIEASDKEIATILAPPPPAPAPSSVN